MHQHCGWKTNNMNKYHEHAEGVGKYGCGYGSELARGQNARSLQEQRMSQTHTTAGCTNEKTNHEMIGSLENELRTVFRKPGMRQRSKQPLLEDLRDDKRPDAILNRIWKRSEDHYFAYDAEMPEVKDMDIIRDDKSKYLVWMMHSDATQFANVVYVANSPSWRILCMTHGAAHRAILERMKTTQSERLWRILKLWRRPMLPPKMSITVKSKSFPSWNW